MWYMGLTPGVKASLNELATGFAFAISAVFANRLMISLRESYYNQLEATQLFNPNSTLQFSPRYATQRTSAFPESGETSTSREESATYWDSENSVELQTFNERAGF